MWSNIRFLTPQTVFRIVKSFCMRENRNVSEGTPWMPWTVIEWFEQTLTPQMSVFEWGSGGSSIFIAQRVRKVISVEYDVIHFFVLWIHTKLRRIANIDYVLVLPENGKAQSIYASTHAKHVGEDYEKYCKTIERFPDNSFDMISIDGRARAGCIHLARKKVKVGGYILVDDSERVSYQDALATLQDFERIDRGGTGPHLFYPHKTSIFKRVV